LIFLKSLNSDLKMEWSNDMNVDSKMLMLSFLAYYDFYRTDIGKLEENMTDMLMSVKDDLDFSDISWGPVAYKDNEVFSDSLIYIVQNKQVGDVPEYTIVIRGTNPVSISSWIFQDLAVSGLVPWIRQSEHTKADRVYISKATDTSLSIHKNLMSAGQTVLDWVLGVLSSDPADNIKLNVTGHSLGGLMCTTFALWLYDELAYQGKTDRVGFNVYSFAGPTAGNDDFVKYTNMKFGRRYVCYENHLDIATHVWVESDMTNVLPGIYAPKIGLKKAEQEALDFFCRQIKSLGYAQLNEIKPVASEIYSGRLFADYLLQAAYQHVVPYLEFAFENAPVTVVKIVIDLLKDLFVSNDFVDMTKAPVNISVPDKNGMFESIGFKNSK
jgi:triacylglycerol lipase